jgi:hypothetical protein
LLFLLFTGCASSGLDSEPTTAEHALPSAATQSSPLSVDSLSDRAPDTRRQIEQQLSRNPGNLRQFEPEDGVRRVRIESGFQHATVVVRNADGTRSQHCVDSAEHALRLLDEVKR